MRAFTYVLIGLLLLVPAFASSQTFTGGVRGAIKDQDGGVLPGTSVTLTNTETSASRTSITNERGEYVFASVAPGRYDLMVNLAGFAPYTREALEIGVAVNCVSVKGKTGEGLDSIGKRQAIRAEACILLRKV